MAMRTLLDQLRSRSKVDCDTFDSSIAEALGPFQDATSNQAIAFFELQEHKHEQLLRDASNLSKSLSDRSNPTKAVDIAMTMLAMQMTPHLKGNAHVQVNPNFSHSTADLVENARAIMSYAKAIDSAFDTSRLCIKIPSTWEGLQACRTLEREGIKTLATTLFALEQAVLAAEMGCTYVAPYVNELRVHFDPGYQDPDPGLDLVAKIQQYFRANGHSTHVMPASLTSLKEVMALAGADHITVAPHLLQKLHETNAGPSLEEEYPSVFDKAAMPNSRKLDVGTEEAFSTALSRSKGGENERKLNEVSRAFRGLHFATRLIRIVTNRQSKYSVIFKGSSRRCSRKPTEQFMISAKRNMQRRGIFQTKPNPPANAYSVMYRRDN